MRVRVPPARSLSTAGKTAPLQISMNDQPEEMQRARECIQKLQDEKFRLVRAITTVIGGCVNGTIKSQPIVITSEDAEEYPMISLREHLTNELAACGATITIKEPAKKKRK